ncbi:hypothetical protein NKI82_05595 [Mesorhizobium sp. M0482]|uniref:hypothetical protein n=1 Tax=Mesorhizobium sp. M0482 TaxID=2956948 RepID=UPI003338F365
MFDTRLVAVLSVLIATCLGGPVCADEEGFLVFSVAGDATIDDLAMAAGEHVGQNARISVPAGGEVTLFGPSGKVVVKAGYSGLLTASKAPAAPPANPAVTPSLWRFVLSTIAFAGNRGTEADDVVSGWAFRIDTPGKKCRVAERPASIGVPTILVGRLAFVREVASGRQAMVALRAPEADWPASLPLGRSSTYESVISGLGKRVRFQLVEIAGAPTLSDQLLRRLAETGCNEQLLQFGAAAPADVVLGDGR